MTWADVALDDLVVIGKLVAVLVLSAMIGWERERRDRAAGLRTHMLVGLSATLFVTLSVPLVDWFAVSAEINASETMQFDPLRVLQAIVAGISFLGAGTIFVAGKDVHGLTTAASILATTAVGTAVAVEHYTLAVGATLLIVVVLALLTRLEDDDSSG